MDWAAIGFWIALLIPAVSYVVYPAAVLVVAHMAGPRPFRPSLGWPTVTVAIAAHNEEATIARAVASALAQPYPGPVVRVLVGLDGCTDRTADVLARLSEPRLDVLDLPRAGKATTDNRLVAASRSDVVVTTSAGSEFGAGSLQALVAPLRDPAIGCVTGIFRPRPTETISSQGEGLYWRFEYAVMSAESRLGILAMASGTALAFRRAAFRPIPADSDADVVVAPNVALVGLRVLHEPAAVVFDDGPASLRTVFRNRRRMALRALPATLAIVARAVAVGRVRVAVSLVAHKLLRWLTPAAGLLWLACAAILVGRAGSPYPVIITTLALAFAALAGLGLLSPRTRGAVASLGVAQLAFAMALVDVARGRRARTWTREPS